MIIFVCNGNIHRSVIAAECLRNIFKEKKISPSFSVNSYGLQGTMGTDLPKHKHLSEYPKEWKAAEPTLQELGIDISKHDFQKVSTNTIKTASIIIAMDDKVYSEAQNSLMRQFPTQAHKIHRFSELTTGNKTIEDPSGSGNKKLHRRIIKCIYSTLRKKYKNILVWAEGHRSAF